MSSDTIPTFISSHSNPYHIGYDEIIINDFNNHINQEGNLRIFFSAKFGTGKSYFLEEFFREKNKEYEVIKLYPINYSTASNNDIFELIKFDILVHLVNSHNELIKKNVKLSTFLQFQWYLKGKLNLDISEPNLDLISCLSENEEINKTLGFNINLVKTLFSIFKVVKKDFKDFQEKQKDDDEEKVLKFLDNINSKFPEYGNLDPITIAIKEIIEEISSSQTKQTVLLIDDLDRLDPEHIFRILNIFGNHFSSSSGNKLYKNENKFGFDKVILVGDTRNIKGIFHHKYGSETDFEGYFSKYSTKTPYSFDIGAILIEKIDDVIKNLKLPDYKDNYQNELTHFKAIVKKLLLHFIKENQIKFRLLGYNNNFIPVKVKQETIGCLTNSTPYTIAKFFIDFFGSKEKLIQVLNDTSDFELNLKVDEEELFFREILFFLNHTLSNIQDLSTLKGDYSEKNCKIDSTKDGSSYTVYYNIRFDNIFIPDTIKHRFYSSNALLRQEKSIPTDNLSISFKKLFQRFLEKYF